jgi:uncharacterized membrane protein YccF (DUF307 family)
MRLIGNILWFIFGGFAMGLAWWIFGLIAFITIIGIPWGRACFMLGRFAFWPFGYEAVNRRIINKRDDIGTGCLGAVGNIIWFIFAGIWLAIGHVTLALAFFVTIIGIPFGIQHVKLAVSSLFPIGQTVVHRDWHRSL